MDKSTLRIAFLLVIGFGVTLDASADARVANIPRSITQTYDDGRFSTLHCPFGNVGKRSCQLTVGEGGRKVLARIDLGSIGYSFVYQAYRLFGTLGTEDVSLVLEVGCIEDDLVLAGPSVEPDCAVRLDLVDGALVPVRTEISFREGDRMRRLERDY